MMSELTSIANKNELELPPPSLPSGGPGASAAISSSRTKDFMPRILLVEDNELNRDMLSRRLMRRGYQVDMAADGKEGLQKADATSPDLILLDLSLPKWTVGGTATSETASRMKSIPVIALTAHALVTDRARALEAGFDDYDIKPVEMPRLLKKMETLLNPEGNS